MAMSERNKMIITFSVAGVITAGLGYLGYALYDDQSTLKGQIKEADDKLKDCISKANGLDDLKKKVQTLVKEVAEIEGKAPGRLPIIPLIYHVKHPSGKLRNLLTMDEYYKTLLDEYDDLFNVVEAIRKDCQVTILSAKRQDPKQGAPAPGAAAVQVPAGFEKVMYEVRVTGRFFPLLRFLNGLESSRRFIMVENFAISSSSSASGGTEEPDTYPMLVQFSSYASTEAIEAGAGGMSSGSKPGGSPPPPPPPPSK